MLEEKLNADTSDYRGPWLSCECGRSARYAGRRRKRFTSVLGPLVLERAYYHCVGCESGFYPRDRELGLEGGSLTPGAVRMVGTAAARVSFAESSQLLAELAGLRIDPKRVERAAEALGGEIAEDECLRVESEPPSAPTMVLGMDGTGVPVRREETEGRAGKQPDGSAKTREVKLVTLWTAESLDPQGRPRRDPGSVSYSAAIESAATRDTDPDLSAFARRVGREAERRGFGLAKRQVVVGDGAPWIWNVTAEQFPEAIEIVDLYHAQEKIWDASRALHAGDPPRLREWAEAGCEALAEGRLDDLLGALRSGAAECEQVRSVRRVYRAQSRPDAVRGLPCPRTFRRFRCRRGRLQDHHRRSAQAFRHALVCPRCQHHHCAALLLPERPFRGLLGASVSQQVKWISKI